MYFHGWRVEKSKVELYAVARPRDPLPARACRAAALAGGICVMVPLYINWSSSQPDSAYPLYGFVIALALTTLYGLRVHVLAEARANMTPGAADDVEGIAVEVPAVVAPVAAAAAAAAAPAAAADPTPPGATPYLPSSAASDSTIAAQRARLSTVRAALRRVPAGSASERCCSHHVVVAHVCR
jgi:hypothetical protein